MKLSEVLSNTPPEKQYPLYRKVKAAIREGTLTAVPIFEEITIHRQNKPLQVLDLYMITEQQRLREWFENAFKDGKRVTGAARYAVKDPEQMTPEELEKRAEEYRASLSKPAPKRKTKK